jgi:hypothetical protein
MFLRITNVKISHKNTPYGSVLNYEFFITIKVTATNVQ